MGSQFRGAAFLTLGLLLSVLVPTPAYAHAAYESSDPANGATVSSPPSRVTAEFTEPVVDNSTLEVYDPCGTRVDNGDSLVAADRITVSMSADKAGRYRVHFSVVSSVDGHPTSGDFGFTSSGGSPCPGEDPAEEDTSEGGNGDPGNGGAGDRSEPGNGSSGNGLQGSATSGSGSGRAEADQRIDESAARNGSARDGRVTEASNDNAQGAESAPIAISFSDITSIWDGIPIGDFMIALVVAALIGAAGGQIYAGILGPRR